MYIKKALVLSAVLLTTLTACQTTTSGSGHLVSQKPSPKNIHSVVENYHLWEKHSRNMKIKPVFAKFKGRDAVAIEARYEDKGAKNDWERFGSSGHAQRYQWLERRKHIAKRGSEYWYKLSYHIPKNTDATNYTLSIFDWKLMSGNSERGVAGGLSIIKGNLTFQMITGSGSQSCQTLNAASEVCQQDTAFINLRPSPDHKGKWVDVIVNVNWDDEGSVRFWLNDELRVSVSNNNTIGNARGAKFKFGPYRHHMDEFNTPIKDVTIHYAGVERAKTCKEISDNCEMLINQIPAQKVYTHNMSHRAICNGGAATCRRF